MSLTSSPPKLHVQVKREHLVGIRTDLPSCNIHACNENGGYLVYPCDNLLVLACTQRQKEPNSRPASYNLRPAVDTNNVGSLPEQSFIETTRPGNILAAYNVSSDGTLLALAENEPVDNTETAHQDKCSLVTIYGTKLRKKKASFRLAQEHVAGNVLHVSFIDATHVLVLGSAPDYNLTLWSIDRTAIGTTTGSTFDTALTPSKAPKHKRPEGFVASVKLATPSDKVLYRADASPLKDKAGNTIICATGNGIVRFFRLANSTFRPVTVNLKRKQQNYVSHKWLSSGKVALGTDSGEIIIIDNFSTREVINLPGPCQTVSSLEEYSTGLIVGSDRGMVHLFEERKENCNAEVACYQQTVSLRLLADQPSSTTVTGIATLETDEAICATSDDQMFKLPLSGVANGVGHKDRRLINHTIPFHRGSGSCITSADVSLWKPVVVVASSWSTNNVPACTGSNDDNTVRIWNYQTKEVEATKRFDARILNVCFHPSSFKIAVCTDDGKLISCNVVRSLEPDAIDNAQGERSSSQRSIDCFTTALPNKIVVSGHVEVTTPGQCRYSNGGEYVAVTSGSILHVYDSYSLKEVCTLRGHSLEIKSIQWQETPPLLQRLCSVGADGVLCIWAIPSGTKVLRHVNALSSFSGGALDATLTRAFVSTASSVSKIDLQVEASSSFDDLPICESGWGMIQVSKCGRVAIGSDAANPGTLHLRVLDDSTHSSTEITTGMNQISSLALFDSHLLAMGSSGSMHLFNVQHMNDAEGGEGGGGCNALETSILSDELLVSKTELDKTTARINSLQENLFAIQRSNADAIQRLEDGHRAELEAILQQEETAIEENGRRYDKAAEDKRQLQLNHKRESAVAQEAHSAAIKEVEGDSAKKISTELEKITRTEAENVANARKWQSEKQNTKECHAHDIERLTADYEQRIKQEVERCCQLSTQREEVLSQHRRFQESLELEVDDKVTAIRMKNENELLVELKSARRLQEEQSILAKQHCSLLSDLDEQKETINSLQEKESELTATIDGIKATIKERQDDMGKQGDNLEVNKQQMNDLTSHCDALEARRSDLNNKIANLKGSLKRIEAAMLQNKKEAAKLEADVSSRERAHSSAKVDISNLKDKGSGMDKEALLQQQRIQDKAAYIAQLETDIKSLAASAVNDPHSEVKAKVIPLCRKYLTSDDGRANATCASFHDIGPAASKEKRSKDNESESERRERHLEKKIATVKAAIETNEKKHRQDMAKLRWQQRVLRDNIADMASKEAAVDDATEGKERKIKVGQNRK